mgnify:CR=1 FL=1
MKISIFRAKEPPVPDRLIQAPEIRERRVLRTRRSGMFSESSVHRGLHDQRKSVSFDIISTLIHK